ncbi:MAG: hypothetical protein ACOYMD_15305, partial [Paludibacter sp.]
MKKIFQHIEKLLAQHDYVVVPNLGGFVVQMQSAVLLPDSIIAPQDTVGFNPLMHHSDGLLAIEIARNEAISYRMAMEYVDNEVLLFKSTLSDTGQLQFGNLGTFHQNESGNLLFYPNSKVDFLPQNFGLADIQISQINQNQTQEPKKVIITLPSTRFYKYAAAAILIFGLLFITPKVNDMRHSNTANLTSLLTENSLKEDVETRNSLSQKAEIVKANDVEIKTENEELKTFHVIIASLGTQKIADQFCETLNKEEFPDVQVLAPSKTYRVAIQSFSNRDSAIL